LFPKLRVYDKGLRLKHLKNFPKVHEFKINSLDLSKNDQHFLSSDDDKLLIWNLEKPEKPHVLGNFLTIFFS
jgi:WD40 repeat protein